MKPTGRKLLAVPVLAFLALAIDGLHGLLPPAAPEALMAVDRGIPVGPAIRPFLLGQQTSAADFFFLKMVQYIGTRSALDSTYPDLLPLAELVTDVDPLFGYAYEVAGIALADPGGRYEDSSKILAKGMENVPDRWQLAFFAAFNRWYGMGDFGGAAPLLLQASKLPGSPAYLGDLASRLFVEAGDIGVGLSLIEAALAQRLPERSRVDLEARRRDLLVERELREVDLAVVRFVGREGRRPSSYDELRTKENLPPSPFPIEYNSESGEVTSPLLPTRIRLHHTDPKLAPLVRD